MSAPVIIVTPKGDRSGHLMARTEGTPDIQVGQFVLRASPAGRPEELKAWLWPVGGQHPPLMKSVEALTLASAEDIEADLNRRVEHEGAWWA
jgi:hypothetical protein